MDNKNVKKIPALIAVALMLQSLLLSPAQAAVSFVPDSAGSQEGSISGDTALKTIGPLQMSEGKIVIQQNSITVLSNSSDPPQDAELKGAVIKAHAAHDAKGETVEGIAVFNQGFSVPALDNVQVQDSVKTSEGTEYVGRIGEVTPKILRIQTSEGIKIIPTRFITDIKSTRAYKFSLPLESKTSSQAPGALLKGLSASQATSKSTAVAPAVVSSSLPDSIQMPPITLASSDEEPTLIAQASQSPPPGASPGMVTFTPTYILDPNAPSPAPKTPSYQAQLTQRHPGKKAVRLAGYAAFAAACCLVPLAFCTIAKPPPAN